MKLKGLLSTSVAIVTGLIVLLGYFFGTQPENALFKLRLVILNWAVILAAFALFVGVINLISVHSNRISKKAKGGFYSLALILSLLVTLAVGFLPLQYRNVGLSFVFNAVQLPVEASLMAVLAVTLTYASVRLLRRRLNLLSVIFLVTALLVLLGTAPIPYFGDVPVLGDLIRPFITQVLAAAGARGILLGVALGTLTTGLRILIGADRPYEGK